MLQSPIEFQKLTLVEKQGTVYWIGKDTSAWASQLIAPYLTGIGEPSGGNNRQLAFSQWYKPDESAPPAGRRYLFQVADTDNISAWVQYGLTLAELTVQVEDVGGGELGKATYDLTSLYQQGNVFHLYIQYDGYASVDGERLKVLINGAQIAPNFTSTPVPAGPLDLGRSTSEQGARPMWGSSIAASYMIGRAGQIRVFHGDSVSQDNPGLPDLDHVAQLYNFGVGEPSSLQGVAGFESLLAEWFADEQTGGTAADTSGNGFDLTVPADPGWGGSDLLEVDLESWNRKAAFKAGDFVPGTTSDVTEFRLRNNGSQRENCGLVLAAEGVDSAEALARVIAWGDAGAGFQVQQRNGAGGGDWGSWVTLETDVGDSAANRLLLDPYTVATANGVQGVIPPAASTRSFRTRLLVPSDAEALPARVFIRAQYDLG